MCRPQICFRTVLIIFCMSSVSCSTVLTVITPGPKSHLFGLKKMTQALQVKGHSVAVGNYKVAPLYISSACDCFPALEGNDDGRTPADCSQLAQYLAREADVNGLLPTSVPIFTYRVASEAQGSEAAHVTAKGRTTLLTMIPQLHSMFDAACNAVLANATAMSAVQVGPPAQSQTSLLPDGVSSAYDWGILSWLFC